MWCLCLLFCLLFSATVQCSTPKHPHHYRQYAAQTVKSIYGYAASPRDCSEVQRGGQTKSGVYTIYPKYEGVRVYCDLVTNGGGWTVFQRRIDGDVDFFLGWDDYKIGFGDPDDGEYWLGNDYIHWVSKRLKHELRVELEDWGGSKRYAKYGNFLVGGGGTQYKLRVSSYSGNAGDSLAVHNGMMFSTKDRDNDRSGVYHCAQNHRGSWWFNSCRESTLNGIYMDNSIDLYQIGICWYRWRGWYYSFKKTEMKMRPVNFGH